MFTLQANQLQSALRAQFGNTPTAQDMVQALCNCAQVIEHRGPMQFSFSDPSMGALPPNVPLPAGLAAPIAAETGPPLLPTGPTYQIINFPPFQPLQWDQIPFIDIPSNVPFAPPSFAWTVDGGSYNTVMNALPGAPQSPYPAGGSFAYSPQVVIDGAEGSFGNFGYTAPGGGWDYTGSPFNNWFAPPPAMSVPGPVYAGPIHAGPVSSPQVTTNNTYNYGDTYVQGDSYYEGDTVIQGDTHNYGDTLHEGPVVSMEEHIHQGDVFNDGPHINTATHHHHGPAHFHNNMVVFVNGQPFRTQRTRVLTDVVLGLDGCDIVLNKRYSNAITFAANAAPLFVKSKITANRKTQVVSDVNWDDVNKKFAKTTRTIDYFGCAPGAQVATDVFVSVGVKFDPDNCVLTVDAADPPEHEPIAAPP